MISVVIPTLNAETGLAATLTALVPAAVEGLVREAIVVDGGSTDRTLDIADQAGAEIVKAEPGRGSQLKAGAARARFPWLLFLNAGTELEPGWEREAAAFIERAERNPRHASAAAFRFAVIDQSLAARLYERFVNLSSGVSKLPDGAQGLLISKSLYEAIGGHAPLPMMEDRDLARRLGRSRIMTLKSRAHTGPAHLPSRSYLSRALHDQSCLLLCLMRVPVRRIARLYGFEANSARPDSAARTEGSIGHP